MVPRLTSGTLTLALATLASFSFAAAEAVTQAAPSGVWRGTSICTDRAALSACHDDVAVYEFTAGATPGTEEASVRQALKRLLTAFENLDWDAFRGCFDDDATVFFPVPGWPERSEGRAAYEARFRQVFDETRASSPGPPFQHLDPEDLRIDVLGADAAVATFHLRNAQRLARRTVVFRKVGGGWRILHLHASNVSQR